jgi:hypothetical protein
VLRKRLAVLVAAAIMVLSMLAASAPAFAQECSGDSCDPQPGQTVKSRDPVGAPPQEKPGSSQRTTIADEKDPSGSQTGRGERISESSP